MAGKPTVFAKAFAEAIRKRSTGVIRAEGKPAKAVWFRSGSPTHVVTHDPVLRFTQILVRLALISRTEAMLVEEEFDDPSKPEEAGLLASDTLTPAEVREYGLKVTAERLLAMAAIPDPVWTFSAGEPPKGTPEYEAPGLATLARALREYSPERLKQEFPVLDADRYQLERGEIQRLGLELSPEESAVARAIEAGQPWAQAVVASGVERAQAERALYLFVLLGAASYLGSAPAATLAAPARTAAAEPAAAIPHVGFGRAEEMRARASLGIGDVLEIPAEAEFPAIHAGFKQLIARYDLGNAHQLPEADRDAALALLDRACDAFLVMTDSRTRTKFFDTAPWDRDGIVTGLAGELNAEKNYVKAGVFLEAGNFLAAEAAILPALHLEPKDARFHLRMGIAIFQRARARGTPIPIGATRALEKAVALDPKSYEAWLYLGHVAAENGDGFTALQHYERALEINPLSDDARRGAARQRK
ncbi:MAG TPA: tetratricopeptide repeat protein [bacterium]|nr:tetratricopeptide repeat protein [bacterium]